MPSQLFNPFFGCSHAALAFKWEWFGHDCHGQDTEFPRHFCNHWCSPGSGTTPIPPSKKNLSATCKLLRNSTPPSSCALPPHSWVAACPKPFGTSLPKLNG